jgi:nuclease-like protein
MSHELVHLAKMRAKFALPAFLLLASHALAQDLIVGRCVGITDGDTIRVLTLEKELLRVRVAFVDAPEKSQAFGQRARQAMSELVFDKDVTLQFHTVDRYDASSQWSSSTGKTPAWSRLKKDWLRPIRSICRKLLSKFNRATRPPNPQLGLYKSGYGLMEP